MAILQNNPEVRDERRANWMDNERILAGVFLLPAVVYIVTLVGIPFIFAILYAFSDATIGAPQIDRLTFREWRACKLKMPNCSKTSTA